MRQILLITARTLGRICRNYVHVLGKSPDRRGRDETLGD